MRRRATKVIAAPLVTATVVATEVTTVAAPETHLAASQEHRHPTTTVPPSTTAPPTTAPMPVTSVALSPAATTATGAAVHRVAARALTPRAATASRGRAPAATKATSAPPAPHTAHTVPLGAFVGGANLSTLTHFAAATATRPTMAADYLNGSDGWSAMVNVGSFGAWKGTGYRLVLGVPIIPDGTGGSLGAGAAGAYNANFVTLAQNLVSAGFGNAVLRLGWEFNGNWYNWGVANSTDAANFAAYWRNIVTAMRSVPGQAFAFLWNPNGSGPTNYTPDQAYPGDSYVDYIGTDIYDNCWCTPQTPQNAWAAQLSQAWGLNWLASFAAAHKKAIAFPEWSVDYRSDGHGLGDDPYFINQFASWIASNNVAFTDIFAFDGSGQQNDITDGSFPNALAAFKADFAS